jgi:hypothetical protein
MRKNTWTVANGNEVHDQPTYYDERGARIGETPNRICRVEYPYNDADAQAGVAALIAAAPMLLEAAREVLAALMYDGLEEFDADKLRSAISAAEGKS